MTAAISDTPELFFVRHGETDWNRAGRFQGHTDVPMNDVGLQQAREAGERLRSLLSSDAIRDIAIISSPLSRARQTAVEICSILSRQESAVEINDVLKEISHGDWEGMTTLEVKSAFPELRRARKTDRWNFSAPGGESYAARAPEVAGFLKEIDRPTVLVCHAGVIKICLYLLGAVDRQNAPVSTISHGKVYAWSKRRLAAL